MLFKGCVAATISIRHSGWAAPSQAARGRAGLVPDVLDAYPNVTVVASKVALAYLKGLTHRPFTERAVKGGDKVGPVARMLSALTAGRAGTGTHADAHRHSVLTGRGAAQIDLGGGHEVEFVMAPNLHWPDTMFSFDHKTGAPLGSMPLAACGRNRLTQTQGMHAQRCTF
jgi:hypothetical protein